MLSYLCWLPLVLSYLPKFWQVSKRFHRQTPLFREQLRRDLLSCTRIHNIIRLRPFHFPVSVVLCPQSVLFRSHSWSDFYLFYLRQKHFYQSPSTCSSEDEICTFLKYVMAGSGYSQSKLIQCVHTVNTFGVQMHKLSFHSHNIH